MLLSTFITILLAGLITANPAIPPHPVQVPPKATSTPIVRKIASPPLQSQIAVPVATAASILPIPSPTDYISNVLYGHNIHRANHSAVYLIYNTQLAGYAANVAATCNFAHDTSQGGGGYGQNIAAYGSSDMTGITAEFMVGTAISDQWYNGEINNYLPDYYNQPTPDMSNFDSWGHFAQMVWASTTSVGCATQLCSVGTIFDDMKSYFTVCNYQGPGNTDGFYPSNVKVPLGHVTFEP